MYFSILFQYWHQHTASVGNTEIQFVGYSGLFILMAKLLIDKNKFKIQILNGNRKNNLCQCQFVISLVIS